MNIVFSASKCSCRLSKELKLLLLRWIISAAVNPFRSRVGKFVLVVSQRANGGILFKCWLWHGHLDMTYISFLPGDLGGHPRARLEAKTRTGLWNKGSKKSQVVLHDKWVLYEQNDKHWFSAWPLLHTWYDRTAFNVVCCW